ncbi:MAG: cell division protein ZapB [Spirochaetales bacterium]|nr:cell division protein ZapB [Spirochaetales bacterium]
MITLDQIKQLDIKVRKAIDIINSLTSENKMLQDKLDTYQLRIEELEILIDTFKEDQGEIEHGIIDALNQLDTLDNNKIVPEENIHQEQEQTESAEESNESDVEETEEKEESKDDSSLKSELETDPEHSDADKEEKPDETADDSDGTEIELDIF